MEKTGLELRSSIRRIENPDIALLICGSTDETPCFYLQGVELKGADGCWQIAEGLNGRQFVTSLGEINASSCQVHSTADGGWEIRLSGSAADWEAEETITLPPTGSVIYRQQTYRFLRNCRTAVQSSLLLRHHDDIRYTYPLQAHERRLPDLPPMRAPTDWAVPLPFHIWHNSRYVAVYGLDKRFSVGTLDFSPISEGAVLGLYYPDTCPEGPEFKLPSAPALASFQAGDQVALRQIIAAQFLLPSQEPLLEAERIAASVLCREAPCFQDLEKVTRRLVDFYKNCELWEPDALGPGQGWFRNMWVRTQTGPAKKEGEMSGYYDLGWGEGIAVEMWMGAVRRWKRTGEGDLLHYVNEMTRGMDFFKRTDAPNAPYFDRTDGKRCGDFLMDRVPGFRIWTHSLGHMGSQLAQLYQEAADYPQPEIREQWLRAASSIAAFLAGQQRSNGDLPDIFDEDDREANRKLHRITARAVVCGLWTRLADILKQEVWKERAERLAQAVAPEIERYEYYNQMLDGIVAPDTEYVDGEAAYYVLEGLVPLYVMTRDQAVLALCKKAAAFALAWTYFYDLPKANNGVARGGQCCRMNDLPLLYPIGSAKAMQPLLSLAQATRDTFFSKMAGEAAAFISQWQLDAPGTPFHGGMIHALGQFCGKHWGPDLAGQIDSGMATGNSLAALELWMSQNPLPEYQSLS